MTNTINFSDWEKLDLRVAEVIKVEDVEGADKLYKLTLDVDDLGERIVCAGVKDYYSRDELKGKKVILLANLAPRKMKGIESQGMILAAVNKDESEIVLVSPENEIAVGSKIR